MNNNSIKEYALYMLAYSMGVEKNNISVAKSGMCVFFTAGKYNIQRNQNKEEIKLWYDAIDFLEANGYIERVHIKDQIYDITESGRMEARDYINRTGLDITNYPKDTIDSLLN